ncbi:hypothetical protein PanWU01x14_184790 [Parasponia andersonii]|uniref:Uncharacterized protein n=1 Tax=Parasponia andersonii TaxID=3476 RepID=A0A2P5C4D1_PARAD|nr:hypothetical protein PanWU01x14_184790 [Parasponia andersonii]
MFYLQGFSGKTLIGSLTCIFIGIIKQYAGITYGQLLDLLSETFDVNAASKCLTSRTLARLFGQRINQV